MEKREGLSFPRDLDLFYHLIVFRGVVFFQSNYLVDMCYWLSYASWLPSKQKKKINPLLLVFDEKFMLITYIWEIISVSLPCFPERYPTGPLQWKKWP